MTGVGEYGVHAQAGSLAPGGVIGDGRYRLLAQFGVDARCNAQLWRARDGQLARDVALTVLLGDPADLAGAQAARRTLDRAMHAGSFDHAGVARVLDVLSLGHGVLPTEGILGMVVAEWKPGTDLLDLVVDGPVPPGQAAALLEPLASAVEQAHHTGLVLGVDHPQRLRLTPEGSLLLAFPGPLPHATLRDDVKGLGAILYLLLTGRWPLPGGPAALPPAPTAPDGSIVTPRILQPQIPPELSSLAVRSIEDSAVGGIRTSAAILQVLDRVATNDPNTTLTAKDGRANDNDDNAVWTTRKPPKDPERQRKLAIAVGALGVATLIVVVWIITQVIGFFSDSSTAANPGPKAEATISTPARPRTPNPLPLPSAAQLPLTATPLQPNSIRVFDPSGDSDNARRARQVIDGDPGTVWKTDSYRQQFPSYKPGIGLIAVFDTPTKFAEVDITSPSPGTVVEIRTADSLDANIQDTQLVSSPATLANGLTKIQLNQTRPTGYLLIWITALPNNGDNEYQSSIAEINYLPAR